jgi:uncharacterized BrkB/YihY/UPF0761 family membrane protein
MELSKSLGIVGIVILVALLVIVGPIATIWAWNELFGAVHTIELTFNSWCAVVILGMFFTGSSLNYRSKK